MSKEVIRYKIQLANKDWYFVISEEMFKQVAGRAYSFIDDVWRFQDIESRYYVIATRNIAWVEVI